MKCLHCNQTLSIEDVNVQKDIAVCKKCDSIFSLSQEYANSSESSFDLSTPASGAWIKQATDEIKIGASTRSPYAFFLVPFMMVWSGGAIGGIYGTQLVSGQFNPLLCLFGLPFLFASIFFGSFALMTVAGKVEISFNKDAGKVFVGLWKFGWSKRFLWKEIDTVKEKEQIFKYPGGHNGAILLDGKNRISFGSMLNESRRYYLYRGLKQILFIIKSKKAMPVIASR